jgi:autotransporter-associated beta strand protein
MKKIYPALVTDRIVHRFARLALGLACVGFGLIASATPPSGYYLVWNDEFDGSSLNGSKWVTYTGTHRNAVNTSSALSIGGSDLTITTYTSSGTHYTGFIGTQGKFYAKYGYFEALIDWNDAPGMWSAFWLQSDFMDDCPFPSSHLGDTLTYGAEIDIVEHRSQTSAGANIANQGVSNLHSDGYTACGGLDTSSGSSLYGSGLNSGYHTYGLLWDSSNYRFYVDDSQVFSTGAANSEHSEWIVLSSEVLNGGWSGSIPGGGYGSLGSSSTKMKVGYVRYYAPNSMVFWDGSNTAYWTNTANWVASKSLPSGGDVVFSLLGTGNYTTKLGKDYTVNSLSILETSYITIKENTLTINNLVDMNSAWNNAQIDSDVVLGNANTWRIGGGRTLNVNGNLSGGHSLTLDGYGVAALNGNNSYTFPTTVNRGTLRISSDNALGSTNAGTTVANGAQLQIYGAITCAEPLSLNGTTPALRASAGANATLTGPITLANAVTIKLDGGTALAINGTVGGAHSLNLAGDSGSVGIINGSLNTGAFAVTKSGGGTWILAGTNTFTGALNVDSASITANDGALRVTSGAAVGAASSIQIRNNSGAAAASTLQLDGSASPFSISQAIALNGRNNAVPALQNLAGNNTLTGALTMNAGGSDYRIQADADTLTLAGKISAAVSSARTLTFQGNGNILVSGVITNGSAATFNLTKAGAGTLTLAAVNTYNGTTTHNGGTLALAPGGSISNSTAILLGNGAVFDASLVGGFTLGASQMLGGSGAVVGNLTTTPGAQLSPGNGIGTLVFSNRLSLAGGVTNFFDLVNDTTAGGGTNDLIVVAGDLNVSGTNTILITPTVGSLANGRYKLIQYSGTRAGGATNFVVAFNGFAPIASITVDDSIANEIDLVVFANPDNLTWVGDGGANNWDIAAAVNWFNGVGSTQFNLGDKVTFDDSSANRTVNLVGNLAFGSLTLGGTGSYTFSGGGRLTGASGLVKSNALTLTLLTTNNYSGPTVIANGTLQVGNGITSGTLGTGPVVNNGALTFNHPDTITLASVVSGTGNLAKAGPGTLNLSGNNSFSGGLTQSGGIINASNSASLGTGPVLLTNLQQQLILASGVSLNNDITIGGPAGVVATGAIKGPASGSATLNGQILLTVKTPNAGSTTNGGAFDGGNTSGGLIFNGPIISTGGSVHLRVNRITLAGGGSYNLFQNSGTVVLGAENGMATNAVLEGGSSAAGTFDLAGFNQTLNGLQKGGSAATIGNSSTTDDSLLTISGVSSNTTFAGTIQNAVSGGTRKVALTVAGGTFTLNAANTFSGDTRVAFGTLVIANATALQNSPLNLDEEDAGAVSFATLTAATVGGLKGTRDLALVNNASANVALTVASSGTNVYTYAGSLTGGGSLTKSGAGRLVLNGVNTFTGILNVDTAQPSSGNDGALRLASPDALDGAVSIALRNQNAATSVLQLDGSSGEMTLPQNLALNGRNPPSVALQNVTGANTLNGNVSFGSGGTNYYFQSDSGTLIFGGALGMHALTSPRLIAFQGSGDFLVTGFITNSAATNANIVVKNGPGTLTLAGTNLYLGTTTVNEGAFLVNGVISTNTVTVNGGSLGGSGVIRGAVTIQPGGTLSPGAVSGTTSTLTVSNAVSLTGTTVMQLNRANSPNASRLAAASVSYGGTLQAVNVGPLLQVGDTFDLFDWSGVRSGSFTSVALPAGYTWNTNNLTVNGTISVSAVEPAPTLNFVNNPGSLDFSWSSSFVYKLQAQTNSLDAGLSPDSAAWFDYPGGGVSPVTVPVDPAQPAMFFRLAPAP